MGEGAVMRRLWLAWAWSRLTGQHRVPWWEVESEARAAAVRERVLAALQQEIDGRGSKICEALRAQWREP